MAFGRNYKYALMFKETSDIRLEPPCARYILEKKSPRIVILHDFCVLLHIESEKLEYSSNMKNILVLFITLIGFTKSC